MLSGSIAVILHFEGTSVDSADSPNTTPTKTNDQSNNKQGNGTPRQVKSAVTTGKDWEGTGRRTGFFKSKVCESLLTKTPDNYSM